MLLLEGEPAGIDIELIQNSAETAHAPRCWAVTLRSCCRKTDASTGCGPAIGRRPVRTRRLGMPSPLYLLI